MIETNEQKLNKYRGEIEDIVFGKKWFVKHQSKLLWLLNTPFVKIFFRWIIGIEKITLPLKEKVIEIFPSSFSYGDKKVLMDFIIFKDGHRELFDINNKKHQRLSKKLKFEKGLADQRTSNFRSGDTFAKNLYRKLKPLWYLFHVIDWALFDRYEELASLSFGFSTITKYPDVGTGGVAINGQAHRQGVTEAWGTIRAGAGNASNAGGSFGYVDFQGNGSGTWQFLGRVIFCFDTSAIGSTPTVSSAVLSITGNQKYDMSSNNPAIDIYATTPASTGNIQNSDFGQFGSTSMSGAPISYAGWATGSYNAFTFNATGISNINKTGSSKFGARESNFDVTGTTPPNNTFNYYTAFYIYLENYGVLPPQLVVTYATATAPTVTTQAVSSILSTTATGNGNVTSDGGSAITERGICWNTSTGPTTANSKATASGTTGAYTAAMTGLVQNTLYYVRAYAINAIGTSYGNEVTFTTLVSGPVNVKTVNGLVRASVKTVNGLVRASIKTWNGLS